MYQGLDNDSKDLVFSKPLLAFRQRKKYLVVEDDFTLQSVWESVIRLVNPRALIRWTRSTEGAERLIEAQNQKQDQFDFVIADIFLSGEKSGIDLWKKHKNSQMVFLFTSSVTERRWIQLMGPDYNEDLTYIQKPFVITECIETLNLLLESPSQHKKAEN